MGRFVVGFLVASALWGAVFFAARQGALPGLLAASGPDETSVDAGPDEAALASDDDEDDGKKRRRRRRRGRRRARGPSNGDLNETVVEGDDLDGDDVRELDLGAEGGEAQLSAGEVDAAMGAAMGKIRRCLVLAAGEAPVRGRLRFDLRVGSDGAVQGVRLQGPAAVASGEAGACLRGAARQVRFPSYDGPPTRGSWSLTLE